MCCQVAARRSRPGGRRPVASRTDGDLAQQPGVSVMRVITIASGKGGVGKSTVSLNLALALAERGHRVGLLDADLYGPDIPLMIGLTRQERLRSWDLWRSSGPVRLEPVERFGIRVMSAGFLLARTRRWRLPPRWSRWCCTSC
jgi:Mrp family chromosome partitioning ATPase